MNTGKSGFRDGVATEPEALSLGSDRMPRKKRKFMWNPTNPKRTTWEIVKSKKGEKESMKSSGFHSFTTTLTEQKKWDLQWGIKEVNRTADPH